MREYEQLIAEYAAAKAQVEFAQTRLASLRDDLVDYMEAEGRKTLSSSQGGYVLRATYSRQTRVTVDEKGLRKRLGAKVYDRYTKRVLDKPLLEEAIESGEVNRVSVQPYVTTKLSDPFIVFSMKEDPREEAAG